MLERPNEPQRIRWPRLLGGRLALGYWVPRTPVAHGFMWGFIVGAGLEVVVGGGTGIGLWIAMPLIGILIAKTYTTRR